MKKIIGFVLVGLLVTGCVSTKRFHREVDLARAEGKAVLSAAKLKFDTEKQAMGKASQANMKKLADQVKDVMAEKASVEIADAKIQALLALNCGCAHLDVLIKGPGGPVQRIKNYLALNCGCAHKDVLR